MRTINTLIAALVLGTAAAAGAAEIQIATVQYSDLNLAAVEGRNTLDARLNAAAAKVCGNGFTLQSKLEARSCQRDATTAARTEASKAIRAFGTQQVASN